MRGQPVFMLSILLQSLEPILRQTAGVAPWQVRCPRGSEQGHISYANSVELPTSLCSMCRSHIVPGSHGGAVAGMLALRKHNCL